MHLYTLVPALLCVSVHQVGSSQSKDDSDSSGAYNLTYFNFDNTDDFTIYRRYKSKIEFKKFTRRKDLNSGPRTEHSTGTPLGAFYMFDVYNDLSIESMFKGSSTVRNATMDSPSFPPADNYCIQFWYSLYGPDVYGLDVFVREDGGYGMPSWSQRGHQGTQWSLGQFELDSEYTYIPFQVEFVAYTNYYYTSGYSVKEYNRNGNVAIDDLYVYNTKCANIPLCPKNAVTNTVDGVTSCYTVHTEPKAWKEAFDMCRRQGARSALVSIESQLEQDFLLNLVETDPDYAAAGESGGFWTSGNDLWKQDANFEWTDQGYGVKFNYTNWHSRQPNNVAGKQHCVVMEYADDSYTWGDERCETERSFICEVYFETQQ